MRRRIIFQCNTSHLTQNKIPLKCQQNRVADVAEEKNSYWKWIAIKHYDFLFTEKCCKNGIEQAFASTIGKCHLQMKRVNYQFFPASKPFPVIMFQLIIQFDVNSFFLMFFLCNFFHWILSTYCAMNARAHRDLSDSSRIYGLTHKLYWLYSSAIAISMWWHRNILDIQLIVHFHKSFSWTDTERNYIAISKWEQNQLAQNYSISGNGKPLLFSP